MDVGGWLRNLGLEQYEAAFRDNAINEKVLPSLTAEDLKDLAAAWSGTAARFSTRSPLCGLTWTRKRPQPHRD